MAKVTVTLTGFDALQRALAGAPEAVRDMSSSAIASSAFAIAQRARALVPVASGDLKRAIATSMVARGLTGSVGLSTPDTPYWRYVEFGTRFMAARPFFRPAAEMERDSFVQRMRDIGPRLERDLSTGRFT